MMSTMRVDILLVYVNLSVNCSLHVDMELFLVGVLKDFVTKLLR